MHNTYVCFHITEIIIFFKNMLVKMQQQKKNKKYKCLVTLYSKVQYVSVT